MISAERREYDVTELYSEVDKRGWEVCSKDIISSTIAKCVIFQWLTVEERVLEEV